MIVPNQALKTAIDAFMANTVLPENLEVLDGTKQLRDYPMPYFLILGNKIIPINYDGTTITLRTTDVGV